MPILIKKAQNGLKIQRDTTGYYDRSAALMEKYKNLNWVKRANDPNVGPESVDDRSHYMGFSEFDKDLYAYPVYENDTFLIST